MKMHACWWWRGGKHVVVLARFSGLLVSIESDFLSSVRRASCCSSLSFQHHALDQLLNTQNFSMRLAAVYRPAFTCVSSSLNPAQMANVSRSSFSQLTSGTCRSHSSLIGEFPVMVALFAARHPSLGLLHDADVCYFASGFETGKGRNV